MKAKLIGKQSLMLRKGSFRAVFSGPEFPQRGVDRATVSNME